MLSFLRHLFDFREVKLAIVRRYTNFNGHHVGELYLGEDILDGKLRGYRMIGASLDSLPLDGTIPRFWSLDTRNDFIAPLKANTLRVGSQEPLDNEWVQRMVHNLPMWRRELTIRNGFVDEMPEYKNI